MSPVGLQKDSIFKDGIEQYAAASSKPVSASLSELEATTREMFPEWADIMTSAAQAQFLRMLVAMSSAKRVLEIGTFTGFSALAMASALPPDGALVTCDNFCVDARTEQVARRAFASAGETRIDLVVSDALEFLRRVDGPFDFIFLDADKPRYAEYYECILERDLLADDGTLAIDNTLWGGMAASPPQPATDWVGEWAHDVARLNARLVADSRVEVVLLTVRDGLTLVRKSRGRP